MENNCELRPDGDDDDTDLELPIGRREQRSERRDVDGMTGVSVYRRQCALLATCVQRDVVTELASPRLVLRHRNLGTAGCVALACALKKNRHVVELDLEDNDIRKEGATAVAAMLKTNFTVTRLNLAANGLSSGGAAVVGEALRSNRQLRIIDLSGNELGLGDSGLGLLARGMKESASLEEVFLGNNALGEPAAAIIGDAMAVNQSIETLDLSWNRIRQQGAVSLCRSLVRNRTLRRLDVSFNGFAYPGALALQSLVASNRSIRSLDASGNRIDWQGARLIAESLRGATTLDHLKLAGNPLTTTGCQHLIEAVSCPAATLLHLDLTGVPVIGEFTLMAVALQQSREFHFCHGDVVNSHDVLGQQRAERDDPMRRVVEFMKRRQLRPIELFRALDTKVASKIDSSQLFQRLKSIGVDLRDSEMSELIEQIDRTDEQQSIDAGIDYKKMVGGVRLRQAEQRNQKMQLRDHRIQLDRLHQTILETEVELGGQEVGLSDEDIDLDKLRIQNSCRDPSAKTISMTGRLGSRSGSATKAKLATKKKKSKRIVKNKTKK